MSSPATSTRHRTRATARVASAASAVLSDQDMDDYILQEDQLDGSDRRGHNSQTVPTSSVCGSLEVTSQSSSSRLPFAFDQTTAFGAFTLFLLPIVSFGAVIYWLQHHQAVNAKVSSLAFMDQVAQHLHLPSSVSQRLLSYVSAIYSVSYVSIPCLQTLVWSVFYCYLCSFAFTAGYHRLWAHASYKARAPLQLLFAFFGAGNFLGSILTWCKIHRTHHKFLDTDKDPLNAKQGFWYSYIGTNLLGKRRSAGEDSVSIADLEASTIVKMQFQMYPILAVVAGFVFPAFVAEALWKDGVSSFIFAGLIRTSLFVHSHLLIRALGHTWGKRPYSERISARNNTILSVLSLGENFLNFHYEFPSDYRIGFLATHIDATKWVLNVMRLLGLAHSFRATPARKALFRRLELQQAKLNLYRSKIKFGPEPSKLPAISEQQFEQRVAKGELLVKMDNLVLDVSQFIQEHPGGQELLRQKLGKDITISFNGGVQRHSKAARNLASMMRVARIV